MESSVKRTLEYDEITLSIYERIKTVQQIVLEKLVSLGGAGIKVAFKYHM